MVSALFNRRSPQSSPRDFTGSLARSGLLIVPQCSRASRTLRAAAQERGGSPRPDGRSECLDLRSALRGGVNTPSAWCAMATQGVFTMLRIHDDMLDALRLMRGLIAAIA